MDNDPGTNELEQEYESITVTEQYVNKILDVLGVQNIKIDELTLDEAENLRQYLDPRFEGGVLQSRQELLANEIGSKLPPAVQEIVIDYAECMNMTSGETHFPEGEYDVLCSLGGANKAPYDRAKAIFEAIKAGNIKTDCVVLSGSPRPIREAEQRNAASYAPSAQTEADLAKGAKDKLLEEYGELINELGIELSVMETTEGTFTATEIQQLIERYNLEGKTVGLQTTQIYQPFTQLEGSAVGLSCDTKVVVAGHASAPAVVEKRKPETYLSELMRSVLSSVRYYDAQRAKGVRGEL